MKLPTVELWSDLGVALRVNEEDAPRWEAEGWRREPPDAEPKTTSGRKPSLRAVSKKRDEE